MATPVCGIFEGGGAKGPGHVASLKATERNDLEFVGVAGASAGAPIAALVAVGYRADELFDPTQPARNILPLNGITPLFLLDEADWAVFEKAQKRAGAAAFWGVGGGICGAWQAGNAAVDVARTIYARRSSQALRTGRSLPPGRGPCRSALSPLTVTAASPS